MIVGVLNTCVGLCTIFALKWFLDMGDVLANALGYSVGLITSYFLNGRWTFLYDGSMARAAPRFALTVLVAYLTNLAVVMGSIDALHVDDYLAHVLGFVPYTTLTFLGTRYFVFGGPQAAATASLRPR
jgi:putative flippase GtrA